MASTTWILSFCMLLSAVPFSTGVIFDVIPSSSGEYCANLDCSHDAGQQPGGKFSMSKIGLYEITGKTKYLLAYRSLGENDLIVDPTKVNDISGTSAVTKSHADLRLSLRNPTDCRYRTLQCEVEYLDASGKKQVVRKTFAPKEVIVKDDCSCSSISSRLEKLSNRARGANLQIDGIQLNFENIRIGILNVENGTTELAESIARLKESHENLQVAAAERKEVAREIDTQLNTVRDNESQLETSIENVRQFQQDSQDNLDTLDARDKNLDKNLYEKSRIDRAHVDAVNALLRFNGLAESSIINFQKVDADQEERANNLRNESSSLDNQVDQLEENDGVLKANIVDLSAKYAETQRSLAQLASLDTVIDRGLDGLDRNDRELQQDTAEITQATDATKEEIEGIIVDLSELEVIYRGLQKYDGIIDAAFEGFKSRDDEIDAALDELEAKSIIFEQQSTVIVETNRVHQAKVDSFRKIDISQRLDVADMNYNDQKIREQISQQTSNNSILESGINVVQNQAEDINNMLDSLYNKIVVLQNQFSTASVTTMSKTTSTLVLSSCTRNMPHDSPRAPVVIDGEHTALCDTVTAGGGYLVFLRRSIGNEDFYRPWADYKKGFGQPSGDYFLGLDFLAYYTARDYNELRIDMLDKNGKPYYAVYNLTVGNEDSKYVFRVTDYHGTAGDSLGYHNGLPFSTYDQDNDASRSNCAKISGGGFWYNDCYEANPVGAWGVDGENGVIWRSISPDTSLSLIEFKLRHA